MPRDKSILDYASTRRIWHEVDVRFWLTLGVMVALLVLDMSYLIIRITSYD